MKSKLSVFTRVIMLLSSAAILGVLFLPIWKITLTAPQYPEGLMMKIWANKLTGNVDIINGLNHYIGMKTLHAEDFIEFKVLPFIIVGYSVLGILILFLNRRKFLYGYAICYVLIAAACMADFYRWEYNYGHNLNPDAPIQVPGMAYTPPLIGFKQLLNFSAFSFPDFGGFIFAACGVLIVSIAFREWWMHQKAGQHQFKVAVLFPFILIMTNALSSCSQSPQPIAYGSDNCDFCKMTIMDPRFAGEIVTEKGKAYKFDDAHCLVSFLRSDAMQQQKAGGIYFTDYSGNHPFIDAKKSLLLASVEFKTPMGGDVAAFSVRDSMLIVQKKFNAWEVTWSDVLKME